MTARFCRLSWAKIYSSSTRKENKKPPSDEGKGTRKGRNIHEQKYHVERAQECEGAQCCNSWCQVKADCECIDRMSCRMTTGKHKRDKWVGKQKPNQETHTHKKNLRFNFISSRSNFLRIVNEWTQPIPQCGWFGNQTQIKCTKTPRERRTFAIQKPTNLKEKEKKKEQKINGKQAKEEDKK